MATYHLQVKTGKRGQAAAHSAYISRTGKHGKGDKGSDLLATGAGNMPSWSQGDPKTFWRASDKFERSNGSTYREYELALPAELSLPQNLELVQEFLHEVIGPRPYEFAIHAPNAALGSVPQPHAHVMTSGRVSDHIERSAEQHFRRYNAMAPELGGCKKDSGGQHRGQMKEALVATRESWADLQNKHLKLHGHDSRVDHRSLKAQGLARQPERHLGPARVNLMSEQDKSNYMASRTQRVQNQPQAMTL